VRCYTSTDSDDPPWFQQLRAEMLQRDMTQIPEHITAPHEHKFSRTLYGFLPKEINQAPGSRNPVLPIGHHLIWFNPAWPTHELLPDGTDVSQSPGGPWVRRMWAGGSIQLRPDDYYHKKRGLTLDTEMAGVERIKDVRLRGQDHSAKIFVTIERRFARLEQLKEGHRETRGSLGRNGGLGNAMRYFGEQMQQDEGWGDAILKEERNLVFMKERTTAELEAIKAGEGTAVKYLDRAYAHELLLQPTDRLQHRANRNSPTPSCPIVPYFSAFPPSLSTPTSCTSIVTMPATSKAIATYLSTVRSLWSSC
jgi:hypothetical protein